jgi:hypothetical protein
VIQVRGQEDGLAGQLLVAAAQQAGGVPGSGRSGLGVQFDDGTIGGL